MTSSTEFTSSVLPLLSSLNDVAAKKPHYTSGVVSDVWANLTKVIQNTSQPIVNSLTDGMIGDYKGAVTTITAPITDNVQTVSQMGADTVDNVFDDILKAINTFIAWIQGIFNSITGWFDTLISKITDALYNIYTWLTSIIDNVSNWISDNVTAAINAVKQWLNTTINNISDWITTAYDNVASWITTAINNVGAWITSTYNSIADWIGTAINNIVATYETVKQTVTDVFNNFLNWLGGVRDNIVAWWNRTLNNVSLFISNQVIPALNRAREGAEGIVGIAKIVWDFIAKGDYQSAFKTIDDFMHGIGLPAPVAIIQSILSMIAYFWETIHLQFVPMEYNAQKQAQISLGLEPLDLGTAAQAVYRGLMSADEFKHNAALGGIAENRAEKAINANRPLPAPAQIQDSFLRGEISQSEHDSLLAQYGLSGDNIDLIKQLYPVIPQITDLVHFADRWAWDDSIAQRFLYDTEFPEVVKEWCAKIGISEEWFKRYWRSHWQLPGLQDVFEMLHRLREGQVGQPFTDADLDAYLRTTPLPPYFHDKLKAISYNPYTRVDIRRMYKMGVLTKEEVTKAYQDLGYASDKAQTLTEFTIRYYAPEDTTQLDDFANQSRAAYSQGYRQHIISQDEYESFLRGLNYQQDDVDILVQIDNFRILLDDKLFDNQAHRKEWQKLLLNAYDRGLFHVNELRPMLMDMGYSDDEVDLEVGLSDYSRQLTIRNSIAQNIHDQYVNYIINNVELHTILDQFNFTSDEIDKLQEEWDIERALRTKRPPLADLRKFLKAGLLTIDDYLDELRGEGYNEKYVSMYAQTLAAGGA